MEGIHLIPLLSRLKVLLEGNVSRRLVITTLTPSAGQPYGPEAFESAFREIGAFETANGDSRSSRLAELYRRAKSAI